MVAVILHGSFALGETTDRSDVDLLAIVERTLTDEELKALQDDLLEIGRRAPRAVDVRVVTREAASAPTRAPAMELAVGTHGETTETATRVAGEPDLIVEFSMIRAAGRSLLGAEPGEVVGAVPHDWIVAHGDRVLSRWRGLIDDQENAEFMVVTACRIWRFATEAVHCSKAEAGRWALDRDPSLKAVEAALRRRAGDVDVRVEPAEIARVLERARNASAALKRVT